jgi:hypothetical protein
MGDIHEEMLRPISSMPCSGTRLPPLPLHPTDSGAIGRSGDLAGEGGQVAMAQHLPDDLRFAKEISSGR